MKRREEHARICLGAKASRRSVTQRAERSRTGPAGNAILSHIATVVLIMSAGHVRRLGVGVLVGWVSEKWASSPSTLPTHGTTKNNPSFHSCSGNAVKLSCRYECVQRVNPAPGHIKTTHQPAALLSLRLTFLPTPPPAQHRDSLQHNFLLLLLPCHL